MSHPVMKISLPQLSYILLFSLASGMSQGSSNLVCLYDSQETLACAWTPTENMTEAPCNLTASVKYWKPPKTCQLHGSGTRRCLLILKDYSLTVTDKISLVVTCYTGENGKAVQNQEISPFKNIQLNPPCNVHMENASEKSYNITWSLCDISHYLEGKVKYQVQYKIHSSSQADTILQILQDQKWLKLENLAHGTAYEAAVRAKLQKDGGLYGSVWSNWSIPVIWETETEDPSLHVVLVVAGSLASIIILAIALFATSAKLKCLKNVLKIHMPNPDQFFPSLNVVHGGNVQKWLSSPLSMASFHIITTASDVSVLEIMPKGNQELSLHFPKEYLTYMDTSETNSSSCFINSGYFFFQHHDSFDFESCKTYFTYDSIPQESGGSEDGDSCSYQNLSHETTDTSQPSSPMYNITATHEHDCLVKETKDPTEQAECCLRALLCKENFPSSPKEEQDQNQGDFKPTIVPSLSAQECSLCYADQSDKSKGSEAIQNVDPTFTSVENNRPSFLQSAIENQGQANIFCRTISSSQLPRASESYLSLRDLQSHYSHHSI